MSGWEFHAFHDVIVDGVERDGCFWLQRLRDVCVRIVDPFGLVRPAHPSPSVEYVPPDTFLVPNAMTVLDAEAPMPAAGHAIGNLELPRTIDDGDVARFEDRDVFVAVYRDRERCACDLSGSRPGLDSNGAIASLDDHDVLRRYFKRLLSDVVEKLEFFAHDSPLVRGCGVESRIRWRNLECATVAERLLEARAMRGIESVVECTCHEVVVRIYLAIAERALLRLHCHSVLASHGRVLC